MTADDQSEHAPQHTTHGSNGRPRPVRHRRALRLALAGVVAVAPFAMAAAAYGADLVDVYEQASGTSRPTYDRSAERSPTYEVAQSTRETLNQSSDDLATDAAVDEQDVGATGDESDEDDCFKRALWGMVFDAGWDAVNGYSFNIGAELTATANRLTGCLTERVGLPDVTAANLSDYLMESFKSRALEALKADPTTKAFIDWVAVTAWYSIG
jgi:hypothetical protein